MMRSVLAFFAISLVASFGSASEEPMLISYTDYSIRTMPKTVTARGYFHYYPQVTQAMAIIEEKGADVCGFTRKVMDQELHAKWSRSDQVDFGNLLEESNCLELMREMDQDDEKRSKNKESEDHKDEEKEPEFPLTAILAVAFGVLSAFLLVVVLVLIIVNCTKSPDARTPPPSVSSLPCHLPQYPTHPQSSRSYQQRSQRNMNSSPSVHSSRKTEESE